MILWASLIVALCGMLPIRTWAEVVNSFNACPDYFYKNKEPNGFDQSAKKICQKLEHSEYFYATLYSMSHRIPLYSAYRFDYRCMANRERGRSGDWFIEPQLSGNTNAVHMDNDSKHSSSFIKTSQAINADYTKSSYDRGQLSPTSFHCGDGRKATFTLTNSAPIDACFKQGHWNKCEAAVMEILSNQDRRGTAYLVTGTVPDSNNQIPKRGEFDDPNAQDFNRVTVPTHIWTAVCYIHPENREESFSFGYIGVNEAHGHIDIKTVTQLTNDLSEKYKNYNLRIFQDDCFVANPKSEKMFKVLYSKIELPRADQLPMSADIKNTLITASAYSDKKWRPQITEVKMHLVCDSMETWLRKNEEIKHVSGLACALSGDDDMLQTSEELVCRLVPENLYGCTSSCLYNEEAKNYYCFSGNTTTPCSPTYSVVTVNGKKCKSGYTCGQFGYSYYWCYTEDGSWDYCSPPPPLGVTKTGKQCSVKWNCAKYDQSHLWCKNDDGIVEACCSRADSFSTVNGKTCKPDHPCNEYGQKYLWCYTTDGSWDYCCTKYMHTPLQ